MKAEFTAIIEAASEGGYWAICPEISGANGQGDTIEETKDNLTAYLHQTGTQHDAILAKNLMHHRNQCIFQQLCIIIQKDFSW